MLLLCTPCLRPSSFAMCPPLFALQPVLSLSLCLCFCHCPCPASGTHQTSRWDAFVCSLPGPLALYVINDSLSVMRPVATTHMLPDLQMHRVRVL